MGKLIRMEVCVRDLKDIIKVSGNFQVRAISPGNSYKVNFLTEMLMKIKKTTNGELKWVLEFLNFKVDFSA